MNECTRCGSELAKTGRCSDATCPFSNHRQSCQAGWNGHPVKDPHPTDDLRPLACACAGQATPARLVERIASGYYTASKHAVAFAKECLPSKQLMLPANQNEIRRQIPNGYMVIGRDEYEYGATWVQILNRKGEEVVYYDLTEWEEEPEQVMGIILRFAFEGVTEEERCRPSGANTKAESSG